MTDYRTAPVALQLRMTAIRLCDGDPPFEPISGLLVRASGVVRRQDRRIAELEARVRELEAPGAA